MTLKTLAAVVTFALIASSPVPLRRTGAAETPVATGDGPAITHAPVSRLRAGQDFIVEATVTGTRPIVRVIVAYQAGDRLGGVPLQPSGGTTYRARVPAARLGRSSFRYIIFATDEGGRASTWPAPPASESEPSGHPVTVSN